MSQNSFTENQHPKISIQTQLLLDNVRNMIFGTFRKQEVGVLFLAGVANSIFHYTNSENIEPV